MIKVEYIELEKARTVTRAGKACHIYLPLEYLDKKIIGLVEKKHDS